MTDLKTYEGTDENGERVVVYAPNMPKARLNLRHDGRDDWATIYLVEKGEIK